MPALNLQQIGKQVINHLIGRALDGEFVPGVSWVVDTHTLQGRRLVRFFVDGDLDAALATMSDPPAIPDDRQLRVRGAIDIELPDRTVSALRRAFGIDAESIASYQLAQGYRQGLTITLATIDELERRAVAIADQAVADLVGDLVAAGHAPERVQPLRGIFDHQVLLLRQRMDARRQRLHGLGAELESGAGPSLLERVLAEEYATSSEAQADVAAFEDVIRRALREAAVRF